MNLKQRILEANRAYREGRPVMDDQTFDDLCERYAKTVPAAEYAAFRDSLHEASGRVRHPYLMGSLDKLKSDEPAEVLQWLASLPDDGGRLHVSAKVDGISCRLHYGADGRLESATTRGDGTAGLDCTAKVRLAGGGVPAKIRRAGPARRLAGGVDVRGELVIKDADFAGLAGRFANPRNACAGIFNQKDADPALLARVSFLAYEVMGGALAKGEQFAALPAMGFETPWSAEFGRERPFGPAFVEELARLAGEDRGYPTDGLVLSSTGYRAEDRYRPVLQRAFKINRQTALTRIAGVEWGEPSKDGRLSPVALLDPVEVAGCTISRVTLNNLDWIARTGVGIGATVRIVKAGDVIPKIGEVVASGAAPITPPAVCPACGARLAVEGAHAVCPNGRCPARGRESVLALLRNLGVKGVALESLRAWGVDGFDALASFRPAPDRGMPSVLVRELAARIARLGPAGLFRKLPFRDLAEKTLGRIEEHYGWEAVAAGDFSKPGLPPGVGPATMDSFRAQLPYWLAVLRRLLALADGAAAAGAVPAPPPPILAPARTAAKGSVCFTGALRTMSRAKAAELAEAAGFEVRGSVVAGLGYLVTNDPGSGSSKNRKAAALGIRIIDEETFLAMVRG